MSELTKAELREYYKKIRKSLTKEEMDYIEKMVFICFTQNGHSHIDGDKLIYVSGEFEIGTRKLMEFYLKDAKRGLGRVLCPRCEKDSNIMHFYVINSFDDLEVGSYGILEPKSYCERVDVFDRPVCFVPALSCDNKGYRLGFGKGFYDRFLADFKGITVGLCCERCVADGELPHDEHDINLDYVITERGWIKDLWTRLREKGLLI